MKLSIITPNLNGGKFLEKTIKSVIEQDYKNIEYIIIDGGSTDNSHDIIKKYSKHISYYEFRKDNNMYEALHYGFRKATGEIFTWLNSDDLYFQNCISKIMFKLQDKNYKWINCISTSINNHKIKSYEIPFFQEVLLEMVDVTKVITVLYPRVSFSKNLYFQSGEIPTEYNYAGDFYLWKKMARIEKMHPISIKCGIFRKHTEQLSWNIDNYYEELKKL